MRIDSTTQKKYIVLELGDYVDVKGMMILLTILCTGFSVFSQQVPDTLYSPVITSAAYPENKGTTIHIDRGHRNFHTRNNRFRPFSNVLAKDGYRVVDYNGMFEKDSLRDISILVVSNALAQSARAPFVTPTESAFTKDEIKVLNQWVKEGGSLFLIADHMPFAGAAASLAKSFGFHFYDSFVFDAEGQGIFDFTRLNSMLVETSITEGRSQNDRISHIKTFTGQAFDIPTEATSILSLTEEHIVFMPDTMWVFNDETQSFPAKHLSQGAYMTYGKGRIVVFGEAAMFTGQLAGPDRVKVGMNAYDAEENFQLLLNVVHWLDGIY